MSKEPNTQKKQAVVLWRPKAPRVCNRDRRYNICSCRLLVPRLPSVKNKKIKAFLATISRKSSLIECWASANSALFFSIFSALGNANQAENSAHVSVRGRILLKFCKSKKPLSARTHLKRRVVLSHKLSTPVDRSHAFDRPVPSAQAIFQAAMWCGMIPEHGQYYAIHTKLENREENGLCFRPGIFRNEFEQRSQTSSNNSLHCTRKSLRLEVWSKRWVTKNRSGRWTNSSLCAIRLTPLPATDTFLFYAL